LKSRDLGLLLLLAAIWGGSFLLMRIAVPGLGPVAVAAMRVAFAALFLLPLMAGRGELPHLQNRWWPLTVAGFWNSALPFCLLAYSASKLTAGVTAVLNSTTPVMTALIGALFLKQKLRITQWFGLGLSIAGVILLSKSRLRWNGEEGVLPLLTSFGAATSYAIGAHYSRTHLAGLPAIPASGGTLSLATLMLLPLAIFTWPATPITVKLWLAGALLGVLCTGVAYICYFRLIATIGATGASCVTVIVPVFAILWGRLILGEKLTFLTAIGAIIVLIGSTLTLGIWSGARER
jgi:drug/metabolite transporter (DMT)-like permease